MFFKPYTLKTEKLFMILKNNFLYYKIIYSAYKRIIKDFLNDGVDIRCPRDLKNHD